MRYCQVERDYLRRSLWNRLATIVMPSRIVRMWLALVLVGILASPSYAGEVRTLVTFTGAANGAYPQASLTLSGSTLYGTTYGGGSSDEGTIFSVNTNGTGFQTLATFTMANGARPYAGLTLIGSTLYGTTLYSGSSNAGTIFAYDLPLPLPEPATTPTIVAFLTALVGLRAFRRACR